MQQDIREPRDQELFILVADAVKEGINLVRNLEAQKKYIGTHFNWPSLKYGEHGLPDFSESFMSGPTNYGEAFGRSESASINYTKIPSFQALLTFAKTKSYFEEHFGTPESAGQSLANFFETLVVLIARDLIDRYLHVYKEQEFTIDLLKPMYILIENGIFEESLEIDIAVPILLVGFDFDHLEIGNNISIVKMSDEFQIARAIERGYSHGIHRFVADAASHVVVFWGWQIKNNGFWQVTNALADISTYPTREIDIFFASLRAVTGFQTGYAQILARLANWTFNYKAHLPSVECVTTRAYPNFFDSGYWRNKIPVIPEDQAKSIGELYSNIIKSNINEILIASRRLNACFSRDNEEDSILDTTIALETLFSDDERQEMTHKLAMRVAAISKLSETMIFSPQEYYQIVKQVYAYRSSIVHGSSKASKKREISIRGEKYLTVNLAVELLRQAIMVLLENPKYLNPVKIDEELLLGSTSSN